MDINKAGQNMRILVIHHVEPQWEEWFNKKELLKALRRHIRKNKYDQVIQSVWDDQNMYDELESYTTTWVNWDYGWDMEDIEEYGMDRNDFIEVSSHHEYTYLYPWIKDLAGHEVNICGGHRDACLRDLEESLEYLRIEYTTIESLVYG